MDAQPLIYGQMAKVMAEITAIGKDKNNVQQGFKYRGIDDVYNAVNPLLAKHGLFMTSRVIEKMRDERTNQKGTVLAFTCLRMQYTFWAADGSSVSTEVEGEGMDSGDKSSNKAMAVAHKYALLQAFCIPTQDLDDPDAETHEVAAKKTPQQPKQEADPFAPSPDEYVTKATETIRNPKVSLDDLRKWWDDEKQSRREAGLSQEHVDILLREMKQRAEPKEQA